MKLLFIHNNYLNPSGEEHSIEAIARLLRDNHHEVIWYRRSSVELEGMFLGKLRAFFLSCFNPVATKVIQEIILKQRPDLIQVQNLYPLISPMILKRIKSFGLPVVMRCPNYRLFCPTGLFLDSSGKICEKCTLSGHEFWCIIKNCAGTWNKSLAYAIRNYVARITKVFSKHVDVFIVQSEFQRKKFMGLSISESKIEVVPGIIPQTNLSRTSKQGKYITYVGRISPEKGIDDFLLAARKILDTKFAVAGKIPEDKIFNYGTSNVEWKGFLTGVELDDLFSNSIVVVVPSKCYEGFPNVITRAMHHCIPVISTDTGCFPDIIDHGINGFMYPSGNIDLLVSYIQWIIINPGWALRMGQNGHEKAEREYSQKVIYEKLMRIYSRTLEVSEKR